MALPASVNSGLSWPTFKSGRLGPFEHNGNLYGVFLDEATDTLEIWKSTDGGETWAEVDSANHPVYGGGTAYATFDTVKVGSTLHIAYCNTENFVIVRQFSLASDAWGSVTSQGSVISGTTGSTEDVHVVSDVAVLLLAVRSDGDYIVLRQGDAQASMGTSYRRVVYSRHEGSTWTNEVDIAELSGSQIHCDLRAIAIDASDRTYFFYTKSSGGLFCRTLTSGNTLNAETTVLSTALSFPSAYSVGAAAFVDDSTDRIVVLAQAAGGGLTIGYANVADSPSWSSAAITLSSGNVAEVVNSNAGSLAVNGTTIHAVWPDDSTQDLWTDSCVSGTWTFGTDTELLDAVTIQGISANYLSGIGSGGVGYFYLDNGTVKYNGPAGATGATGTVSAGTLSVGGQAITATAGSNGVVNTGSHAVSGQTLTGSVPVTGTVNTGSHAVSGQSVSGISGSSGVVNTGSHTVAGQAVAGVTGSNGVVNTGSHAVSGQAVSGVAGTNAAVATGSLAIAGQTVSGTTGANGAIASGSLAVDGQTVTGEDSGTPVTGTVDTGALTVSGQTVSGTTGLTGTVATGSHAVSGQAIAAIAGSNGVVASGTHAVSGQAVAGVGGSVGTVGTGSHVVAGQTVSATVGDTGTVGTGAQSVSGQTVTAVAGSNGVIATGSHAVAGQTVTADPAAAGNVASGSLAIAGQSVMAVGGSVGVVGTGIHTVAGQTVTGASGSEGDINTGTLAVAGQTVTATAAVSETGTVDTGTHAVSGQSVTGVSGTNASVSTGSHTVSGQTVLGTASANAELSSGILAVSGQAISSITGSVGSVGTGSHVVSGQTINADDGGNDETGTIATGELAVSGQSVSGSAGSTGQVTTGELRVLPAHIPISQLVFSTASAPFFGSAAIHQTSQSFSPTSSLSIRAVAMVLGKDPDATDGVFVEIRDDDGGKPSATVVATSLVIPASSVPDIIAFNYATLDWRTFIFADPVVLASGTRYWLVLSRSGVLSNDVYSSGLSNGESYSGESAKYFNGTVWANYSPSTRDLAFQLIENVIVATTGTVGEIGTGALAVTGQPVNGRTGTDATISTGSLSIAGQPIVAYPGATGTVDTGLLTIDGEPITVSWGTVAIIESGLLVVSGQVVTGEVITPGDIVFTLQSGRVLAFRLLTERVLDFQMQNDSGRVLAFRLLTERVLDFQMQNDPVLSFSTKGDYDGSN